MRAIYKFPIPEEPIVMMPRNAKVLCIQAQDGIPTIWAMVDTDQLPEQRCFQVIGTGWDVDRDHDPPLGVYIGTVQLGGFVWHFFDPKGEGYGRNRDNQMTPEERASKPKIRIVEFHDDGHSALGTYFVFLHDQPTNEGKVYSVDFEIHPVICCEAAPELPAEPKNPKFEKYNCQGSGDETPKLDEACPEVKGMVKWDGCSHIYFGNAPEPGGEPSGYIHICGQHCWLALTKRLMMAYERCGEILKQYKTWDDR